LPVLGLSLAACAERPEVDQVAQTAMIGLSSRDILGCMGAPGDRRAVAQATEIWSYPIGYTATAAPPWAAGLDFALSAKPTSCNVRLVMTNAHVSQVTYALPDGRALPLGRQCVFAVRACAARRERL
jgi:LmbE family N-acetylglucosaminyl deacetylase